MQLGFFCYASNVAEFIVDGGVPLKGTVKIGGSKNAALPILAATLLTNEPCTIKNVPDIEDVHTMIGLLKLLGSEVEFVRNTVKIQTKKINKEPLPQKSHDFACKMRASVILLGAMLARNGVARLPYPGGCVLGSRPIDTHVEIFKQLGVTLMPSKDEEIFFKGRPQKSAVVLPEFSVTATENALLAATAVKKGVEIRLAATEPHVQDLCRFLQKMGCEIRGAGSHTLFIKAPAKLSGVSYTVCSDYLEAGTFVLAGIITRGTLVVENVPINDLDALWNLLREMEVSFVLGPSSVRVTPSKKIRACKRIQTNVFPGFPTDLQPPFAVLLTQAAGTSRIHETLFEGRFSYFPELVKMGARIEKLNPHEANVHGPTALRGAIVKSFDIRAGAAMILAALAANGKTTLRDIHYIDRGYEKFDEKLRAAGAKIQRVI